MQIPPQLWVGSTIQELVGEMIAVQPAALLCRGTMSATASPYTVKVTRSPERMASIT